MEACLPFKPSHGSWRTVNQMFKLVEMEAPPEGANPDMPYIDYVRFLDRYVGEISTLEQGRHASMARRVSERVLQRLHSESAEDIFRDLDRDGTGHLDVHELASRLERLGMGLTRDQLTRLMNAVDANHDGRIDRECVWGRMKGEANDSPPSMSSVAGSQGIPEAV